MRRPEAPGYKEAEAVADALLYEGYVLYPYRASASKNVARWQFGVLVPRAYAEVDGYERTGVHNQVLLETSREGSLHSRVRFLQLQHRQVEVRNEYGFRAVDRLEVAGRSISSWDEAVERTLDLRLELRSGSAAEEEMTFHFDGGQEVEELVGPSGEVEGRLVRTRQELDGQARLVAEPAPALPSGHFRVALSVQNTSGWRPSGNSRAEALARSLLGVHSIVFTDAGRFLSLLEPPAHAAAAVARLRNEGAFPVLVGPDDQVALCSPIILYDHPQVAPESPGDLYDATEIDEILALRVLTLTEEEKREARGTDPRAASVVERCESMDSDAWGRLHGTIRHIHPVDAKPDPSAGERPGTAASGAPGSADPTERWWDPTFDTNAAPGTDSVLVGDVEISRGSKVRLNPCRRADAQDLFLAGQVATVEGVFEDLEGGWHVAVSLDEDPAAEELLWQARYLYFHPEEIEPIPPGLTGEGRR